MFTKALTFAAIFAGSLALPDVTIKALPAGCASYPVYDAEKKTAGPWTQALVNSDNPALKNVGGGARYSAEVGSQGTVMRWGQVTANTAIDVARHNMQCTEDKLQIYAVTKMDTPDVPGTFTFTWTPLVLSRDPSDATLMYLVDGEQPTLYEHYVGGVKQNGWFLGGYNTTTWGVQWHEAEPASYNSTYYYMRLLPEGQQLKANETKTFLQLHIW